MSGKLTVKGSPADAEQRAILKRALAYADKVKAPYRAKVALIEALIVESTARNLKGTSADGYGSFGVLQGREKYHKRADLLDPEYQFGVFLGTGRGAKKYPKGFTGRGNAVQLARGGMRSGDIAQAVEGSAYPDRYGQVQKEAMRNIRALRGMGVNASTASTAATAAPTAGGAGGRTLTTSREVPNPVAGLLNERLGADNLIVKLGLLKPTRTVTDTVALPDAPRAAPRASQAPLSPGGRMPTSGLKELIYTPLGKSVKNGAVVAPYAQKTHHNHVHVAAGKKTIVQLGKLAQEMGLNVGEHDAFGGVDPVHVNGSYHYRGMGIDVSGDPAKMKRYAKTVAKRYGLRV